MDTSIELLKEKLSILKIKIDNFNNHKKDFLKEKRNTIIKDKIIISSIVSSVGVLLSIPFPIIGLPYHITTIIYQTLDGIRLYKKAKNCEYMQNIDKEIDGLNKEHKTLFTSLLKEEKKINREYLDKLKNTNQNDKFKIDNFISKINTETVRNEVLRKMTQDNIYKLKSSTILNKSEEKDKEIITYDLKDRVEQTIIFLEENNMIDDVKKLTKAQKEYEEIYVKSKRYNIKNIEQEASNNLKELLRVLQEQLEEKIVNELAAKSDNIKIIGKSMKI